MHKMKLPHIRLASAAAGTGTNKVLLVNAFLLFVHTRSKWVYVPSQASKTCQLFTVS